MSTSLLLRLLLGVVVVVAATTSFSDHKYDVLNFVKFVAGDTIEYIAVDVPRHAIQVNLLFYTNAETFQPKVLYKHDALPTTDDYGPSSANSSRSKAAAKTLSSRCVRSWAWATSRSSAQATSRWGSQKLMHRMLWPPSNTTCRRCGTIWHWLGVCSAHA